MPLALTLTHADPLLYTTLHLNDAKENGKQTAGVTNHEQAVRKHRMPSVPWLERLITEHACTLLHAVAIVPQQRQQLLE